MADRLSLSLCVTTAPGFWRHHTHLQHGHQLWFTHPLSHTHTYIPSTCPFSQPPLHLSTCSLSTASHLSTCSLSTASHLFIFLPVHSPQPATSSSVYLFTLHSQLPLHLSTCSLSTASYLFTCLPVHSLSTANQPAFFTATVSPFYTS